MAAEVIGRIDKPEAGGVLGKRKLYIVPLVHPLPGAPDGFASRLGKYWTAVEDHVSRLEARAGMVKRIFHEGVGQSGEAAVDRLKQVDMPAFPLIDSRIQAGATLEAFDDDDLFLETIDWGRCLQLSFASRKVAETVSEAFTSTTERRMEHMSTQLDEKLGEGEAGILIASSTQGVKIPEDVEMFSIMPPELDELARWIETTAREQEEAAATAASAQESGAPAEKEIPPEGGRVSDSGLWAPE